MEKPCMTVDWMLFFSTRLALLVVYGLEERKLVSKFMSNFETDHA